ncbi:MAG: tetratricopeptide repeat protein [Clostridia bacterium]|nr:tetratricopeptide repeat protein [Clostridia bacterium]
MAEVLKFSNNEETFYKLYTKRKESGDYIGALFAIKSYKNVATNKLKVYSAFAETYYLLNQYEKSAEYFFKFLAVLDETNSQLKSNYALAYAGLCALYYKVGNKSVAGYYAKKLIVLNVASVEPYAEVVSEFLESVTSVEGNYYIAYPYDKADFNNLLAEAEETYRKGGYEKAIKMLEIIPPNSKFYADKLSINAVCKYITGDSEGAIKDFDNSLKLKPKNVDTLCNAISILNKLNKTKKANKYVKQLKQITTEDKAELYKSILLYTEIGEEDYAILSSEKYLKLNPYDVSVLILLGQIYYNNKYYNKAYDFFNKALEISSSHVPRYYKNLASNKLKNLDAVNTLVYSLDVPDKERKKYIKCLKIFLSKSVKDFDLKDIDLIYYIGNYAFESRSYEMQSLALSAISSMQDVYSNIYLAKQLCKLSVYDEIKSGIVGLLTIDDFEGEYPLCYGNLYKTINFEKVDFAGVGGDVMKEAFSLCYAKTLPSKEESSKLIITACRMYNTGIDFSAFNDVYSLSAVIYELSNVKPITSRRDFAKIFKANLKEVKRLKQLFLSKFNNF